MQNHTGRDEETKLAFHEVTAVPVFLNGSEIVIVCKTCKCSTRLSEFKSGEIRKELFIR
jgi:hypothetical protein